MSFSKECLTLGPGWGWAHSQSRTARLDPSKKQRDIFPLPGVPEVRQLHSLSRRSQQRFDRKRHIYADVQQAVEGLNWMNGFSPKFEFSSDPDPMQQEVLDRIMHLSRVAGFKGSVPSLQPEAALRELLHGREEYDASSVPISLARFDIERISLPSSLDGVPDVMDIIPEEARQFLKSPEQMVREDTSNIDLVTPYWDPLLKNNRGCYKALMKKLHDIGYLRYTRYPKARAGMFFVHKSDKKKIRLIVDARPANQLFNNPPGVHLCTSEGFARMELELPSSVEPGSPAFEEHLKSRGLVFGLADVKDCFHRLRQPEWLSKYFCWDPIPASWVKGLIGTMVDGKKVERGDMLYPMPSSLCMGFSWSLYFAQKANENLMSRVPVLKNSQIMSDRGFPVVFEPEKENTVRHYVYVDNLGIVSSNRELVREGLDELSPYFDDQGLILHPGEIQEQDIRALGSHMRGDLKAVRVTPERYWRLRKSLEALLRRKKISGRILEIVLGHITFCCLCNRQLLCIFSSIYKYIRKHYFAPVVLWPSVRKELEVFRGLMIFLQNDWWKPWNPLVSSSDSSLEGYGVSTAFWPLVDVRTCGRRLERSRFRRPASTAARAHALTSAGFIRDELSQQWRLKEVTDEELIEQSGWEISKDFEEIPGHLLHKDLWEPKLWGRWNFKAGILELEGRALVKSLRRIALSVFGSDVRQLLLVDNMAVALAFDRFRSRSFALLKQIRKFSSYLLSRNISTTVRWIPSEFNSSDEPSRIHAQEASKLLTHLLPTECPGYGAKEGDEAETPFGKKESDSQAKAGATLGAQEEGKIQFIKDTAEARPEEGSLDSQRQISHALQPDGCGLVGASWKFGGKEEEEPLGVKFNQCNERWKPRRKAVEEETASNLKVPSRRADGGQGPHLAGEECNRTSVSKDLCCGVGGVHHLCGAQGIGCSRLRRAGSPIGGLHESPLPGGAPGLQSRQTCCFDPPPLSSVRSPWRFEIASAMEGVEGLQKALPWKVSTGLSTGDLGGGSNPNEAVRSCTDGLVCADGSFNLWPSFRDAEAESVFVGEALSGNYPQLDIADEPRRKTREIQDRGLRRVPKPRLTLDDKLVPYPLLPAQGQPSRSPPMGLRLQRVFKGVQEGGGGAWSGHHSVPDPSFRTFHRPSTWIPKSRRSPEKGPVEGLEVSGSLREVGSPSSNNGKPPDEPADTLPAMRGKPWGNHVRIQKGARVWKRQKQQRYVMDLFAGKGGVSAACQALGFHAKQWDIIHGPEHDLTDKRVLKRLLQEIRRGRVLAVMMAPVCTSFSRARDRTKVIRNHRFPWGIPRRFLSEKEYLSIRLGNTLFRACFAIIEECEKQQIPWLLENPLSSRCWNLPPMRRIIQQRDTHFIHADFCQFGARWKKPTGFLGKRVSDLHRLTRTCQGKHGICNRTSRPHQLLTGTGPGNIPWTLVAQPYPKQLCSQIAHVLTSSYHATSFW